ncbi:hypothetical protein RHMOL_Rhmol02G0258300 [Rhododendron molle]|uniref:Uncharacterized protein n=1 Tax=Rhododendron molle TaxID=49168 RepID=A0ACC0PWL1_RHOML|nr:hypothetical protein RHMOL_Rhmol02G0258300 [Rhododendron molle]
MASIAVLHPQDFIKDHLPRRRPLISRPMNNPHANPNPTRSNRRKRSPEKKNNSSKPINAAAHDFPVKTLVMGQVKILKRGEETTAPSKNPASEKKVGGFGGSGMKAKQTRIGDFYAGSAVMITSPPPSSLPLPGFFTKKNVLRIDNDASADLRRLLRLDLMWKLQNCPSFPLGCISPRMDGKRRDDDLLVKNLIVRRLYLVGEAGQLQAGKPDQGGLAELCVYKVD